MSAQPIRMAPATRKQWQLFCPSSEIRKRGECAKSMKQRESTSICPQVVSSRKSISAQAACTALFQRCSADAEAGSRRRLEATGAAGDATVKQHNCSRLQFPAIIQANFVGQWPGLLRHCFISRSSHPFGAPPQRRQSQPLPGIRSRGAAAFVSTPADSF